MSFRMSIEPNELPAYTFVAETFSFLVDFKASEAHLKESAESSIQEYPDDVGLDFTGGKQKHSATKRMSHKDVNQMIFQNKIRMAFPTFSKFDGDKLLSREILFISELRTAQKDAPLYTSCALKVWKISFENTLILLAPSQRKNVLEPLLSVIVLTFHVIFLLLSTKGFPRQ